MITGNNNSCTGCGACFNICPKSAIVMKHDDYGFYKPFVDKEKCINCGLCENICPLNNYVSNNFPQPKVFAFQNSDKEILYKCASGGAFALFAKYITDNNGVVFGVVYDENLKVCHSVAENFSQVQKMLSSKYVQSDTRDCFKRAKTFLDNGRTVLFSGTPCQIAGLKSYLRKDYENLITVDLVCHGVPSPLVFEKYKSEFLQKCNPEDKILNINFRSKIYGWSQNHVTAVDTTRDTINIPALKDDFMLAFLSNLSINSSCFKCKFNILPRIADISLADFWGVDEYDKSLNDNNGLSVILINSGKGQKYFNKVVEQCFSREIPLESVLKHNPNINGASKAHKNRIKFFEAIKQGKHLKHCVKKYRRKPLYIIIYNRLPVFIKNIIKNAVKKR